MQPKGQSAVQQPTLLLVHGAWHGAWCWEGEFSSRLRAQGYTVETMDLPGHGQAGPQKIGWYSIGDYVDAIEAKLTSIGGPTVVLGHSMGGYAVQKLMERRPPELAGAVLLAAATQRGVWGVVKHLLATQPLNFLAASLERNLYRLVRSPERSRQLFHLPDMPKETLDKLWAQQGNESFRAFMDMLVFAPIHPDKADPGLPKLVLGGELDAIFPADVVTRNAASYGTKATIYSDMPHNLTQNTGWEKVADDIAAWMKQVSVPA